MNGVSYLISVYPRVALSSPCLIPSTFVSRYNVTALDRGQFTDIWLQYSQNTLFLAGRYHVPVTRAHTYTQHTHTMFHTHTIRLGLKLFRVALFSGHRRNGLTTSMSSNCIRM